MDSKKRTVWHCALFAVAFGFCNCYVYMLEKNILSDGWDVVLLICNVAAVGGLAFLFAYKAFIPFLYNMKFGGGNAPL